MTSRRRWRFYTTAMGRRPVQDFLAGPVLPMGDRDEILAAMKDVQINGLHATRHLRGDIHEVRADGHQATYRIISAAEGPRSHVLLGLTASSKKTRRAPPAEIAVAERRLRDWRSRGRRP